MGAVDDAPLAAANANDDGAARVANDDHSNDDDHNDNANDDNDPSSPPRHVVTVDGDADARVVDDHVAADAVAEQSRRSRANSSPASN